jgi:extracellular elastinolytic metalloproteinase
MHWIFVLGLLGSALAHPAPIHKPWKPSLSKRTVDLNQFRISANTTYTNATSTQADSVTKLARRETYVDTATAFVQSVLPNAEFRVADHYVGSNGIAVSPHMNDPRCDRTSTDNEL